MDKATKTFDWKEAERIHSPERVTLMREWYDKPITAEKWVELVKALPPKAMHNAQTRSPSAIKVDYRQLKEKFGFFSSLLQDTK